MTNYYGIILAAGKGTRMKSELYKVLHPVCGKPMVAHVVEQVKKAGAEKLVTIVGHGAERVQDFLGEQTAYALQAEQLGTGHAVLQAESLLGGKEGVTLVVCGDTPLLTAETLANLINVHETSGAKATILTARVDDPTGYGRVVRATDGSVLKNVEQKDATPEEALIQEINTGTYCFDNALLFDALKAVTNENAQGEYYLPDVVQILKEQGELVAAYQMADVQESLGVNDRVALAQAEKLMRLRINEYHMRNGVTFIDPANTYIEATVTIGNDTIIEPGVVLKGNTSIGSRCFIGAQSVIRDAVLEDDVTVLSSAIEEATLKSFSDVGPFGHIRPGSVIGERVHIGNFVEVKNATLDTDTKVGHLTYVGDADLGKDINIGCGTIFVNYDGKNKFRSVVKDRVFIGCNANIIAPVEIAENAYVAAGSTITKDVPAGALAVARARQENKADYAKKLPGAQS